jgi:hypothetical protein
MLITATAKNMSDPINDVREGLARERGCRRAC